MISISSKKPTHRTATAICTVLFSNPSAYTALSTATLQKGDALAVSRVAGIMAAKKTADLIPLAHPGIGVTSVSVEVELFESPKTSDSSRLGERAEAAPGDEDATDPPSAGVSAAPDQDDTTSDASTTPPQSRFGGVAISATVECEGKTGVEMEALTAASVAGLTVYDMCKAVDKGMVMQGVRVVKKTGGKSGAWVWDERSGEVRRVQDGKAEAISTVKAHEEGSEDPSEQFYKLMAMDDKEFAAEVHHAMWRRMTMWEAKMERERIEQGRERAEQEARKEAEQVRTKAEEEEERVKAHVAKCQEEVQRGVRGRVEKERLEKAWMDRRKWFERSTDGTVVAPETREWAVNPEWLRWRIS
jgi:molybdenum cofactor biosynthesis enzyme